MEMWDSFSPLANIFYLHIEVSLSTTYQIQDEFLRIVYMQCIFRDLTHVPVVSNHTVVLPYPLYFIFLIVLHL